MRSPFWKIWYSCLYQNKCAVQDEEYIYHDFLQGCLIEEINL